MQDAKIQHTKTVDQVARRENAEYDIAGRKIVISKDERLA